ncbi:bacteriophage spanin2 family protein [Thalassovita sp.]|uniref:bacteriophage spanin2 family protein n=1 Tax=Thalassovita sp. TaxID=1979401 RepID=UPI002B26BAC9|nr:bacteriophage spanin2 family protein [Thalassovita sp.]
MRRTALALALVLGAGGCGGPLALLTGGGPNVAANVQAGETNTQTVGQSETTTQKIIRPQARDIRQSADRNKVQADRVETVVVQEVPAWLILAFAVAMLLDSPLRWPGQIRAGLRGR